MAQNKMVFVSVVKHGTADTKHSQLFRVTVTSSSREGVWNETVAGNDHLEIFVQGIKAGASLCGHGFSRSDDLPT